MNTNEINNLNETIAQALHQLKTEQGDRFSLEKVNLTELSRRTGISRKRLRNAREHGFGIPVHGNSGRKRPKTVITGYTEIIDNQLVSGVTNSSVIFERLQENGYQGGRTQVTIMEQNRKITEQNERQARQIEALQENVAVLIRNRFGRKTEKVKQTDGQYSLDFDTMTLVLNEVEQLTENGPAAEPEAEKVIVRHPTHHSNTIEFTKYEAEITDILTRF